MVAKILKLIFPGLQKIGQKGILIDYEGEYELVKPF